jgi:rubrerythrin
MIAIASRQDLVVRLFAPLVWRGRRAIARKLLGFAATEAGSALDMLDAAERVEDPRLRKLFFRHALDEAKHARMFTQAARHLTTDARADAYSDIRATRQNLFQRMDLVEFVVFVHVAEKAGRAHFAALARHFSGHPDPDLHDLFTRIEKDERYHVGYTGKQLERWRAQGRGAQIRRAWRRVRLRQGWEAWRRAGRQLADPIARLLLGLVYVFTVPGFALLQRVLDREQLGWKQPRTPSPTLDDLRSQF